MRPPNAVGLGAPADWILPRIRDGRLSAPLVAEDGSTIAFWVGTVTKVDVKSGETISEGEKYRLEVRGETLTAFNVSQETYVRDRSRRSDAVLPLKPLILLDRYRTICVGGDAGTLFLARIDDRQRGPRPNLVRTVRASGPVSPEEITAVGTLAGKYLLEAMVAGRERYLSVDPETLDGRWVKTPRWEGPGVSTRWAAADHFHASEFSMVVTSVNGAYAWAAEMTAGRQWLLHR